MIEIPFLDSLPANIREPLLRLLLALLALAFIWGLRRAVTWVIAQPVRRLLERGPRADRSQIVLEIVRGPTNLLVIALGLMVASRIVTPDGSALDFITRLSRTFVIVAIVVAAFRAVNLIVTSRQALALLTGIVVENQLIPFIRWAIKAIIIALGVVVILQEWNYDVTGLVAGLGLAGLAFSLAAQETVADLFAFSTIVSDRPFEVGEYIVTPDVEGIVDSIGPRSTRIRRLDQAYVTVPNSVIAKTPVVNWSRLSRRWVNFVLGVTYNTPSADMRELLQRLRDMLLNHDQVDPETVAVLFNEFGDSSLNIVIRCYVNEKDWVAFNTVREQINLKIMDIVEELGLSIAFPSRSIYIENAPALFPGRPSAQPVVAGVEDDIPFDDEDHEPDSGDEPDR